MSVKERLKNFLKMEGITISEFEKSINVANGYVNSISKSIGLDKIELIIEKFPKLNLQWLLTDKGPMLLKEEGSYSVVSEPAAIYGGKIEPETQNIPLYDIEASAGIVSLFQDSRHSNPIDHIRIPGIPSCDGAIPISGDSMYPLLKSGDIVLYKQVSDPINGIYFFGEMYIIGISQDGEDYVVVKYIQKSELGDDYIKLVSQNQHHDPFDVPKASIRALAIVRASIRINSMK